VLVFEGRHQFVGAIGLLQQEHLLGGAPRPRVGSG
jgi:hypothetical protein